MNGGVNWVGDDDARLEWGRWDAGRTAKVHRFGQVTFSDCEDAEELLALTTILADAGWALPSGCSGSQTFYSSKALVGGNGTAWSSSNVSYKYCVIDAAGSPGYLTAG